MKNKIIYLTMTLLLVASVLAASSGFIIHKPQEFYEREDALIVEPPKNFGTPESKLDITATFKAEFKDSYHQTLLDWRNPYQTYKGIYVYKPWKYNTTSGLYEPGAVARNTKQVEVMINSDLINKNYVRITSTSDVFDGKKHKIRIKSDNKGYIYLLVDGKLEDKKFAKPILEEGFNNSEKLIIGNRLYNVGPLNGIIYKLRIQGGKK